MTRIGLSHYPEANADQPGAAPGGSTDDASSGAAKDEDVVDAEFVDVDDDKKS